MKETEEERRGTKSDERIEEGENGGTREEEEERIEIGNDEGDGSRIGGSV